MASNEGGPVNMLPFTPAPERAFDAVIVDMDGVVTDTAVAHARAWKTLFDEVLDDLSPATVAPFDPLSDYLKYVDGRPREDGIRAFLQSRGIVLPQTSSHRPAPEAGLPVTPTIADLAARKQAIFDGILDAEGVRTIPGATALLRGIRSRGLRTALVTSSRNSARVLQAAGVSGLFDVRVDGTDAISLHLAGKPAPDLFVEAARRMRVSPVRAVVIEDAESGVQAAVHGGFGFVIGFDRSGDVDRLRAAGADLVISDFNQLHRHLEFGGMPADFLAEATGWRGDDGNDPWVLGFSGYDPVTEGTREALCTLGNGYWGTRGASAEADADSVHYPGTYFAGVYNRVRTDLGPRSFDDEEMVNAPNWLPLRFRVADGDWFSPDTVELLAYRQELDLRRGVLNRVLRFRDSAGRTTRVATWRFVSHADPHLAVIDTTFTAEDWSGTLTVRSALEGRVTNSNVAAHRMFAHTHLVARGETQIDADTILLEAETSQSGVHIAMAARTRVFEGEDRLDIPRRFLSADAGWVAQEFVLRLSPGTPVRVEKVVSVATSRDRAILSPGVAVTTRMRRLAEPSELLAAHEREWGILWKQFDVRLRTMPRAALALNLNIFHVLQTVAAVDADLDAGVPARGLHGEGYQGHVFWDELFVYPMLTLRRPDLSRALLGYRYRRLNEARAAARAADFEGAMFPWQSGIDGSDVTPQQLFNTRDGSWMPDNSRLQRHVGLAVAYSVWQYCQSTGDMEYLMREGAELLLEVARFFAGLAVYDKASDRYDIDAVMGPDEFHDGYPGAAGTGLRNNSYTNVMTAWVLLRATETVALLQRRYSDPLWNRLRLRPNEVTQWDHIRRRLRIPFHSDGIISQFDGYEDLAELDWDRYRRQYGSIGRLDLILAAEGDSTNNYRVSKQPDVLMLLYLFSAEELRGLLAGMGYSLPPDAIVRAVEFYGSRSTHGSTLSNVVHSWLEARRDRKRSWAFLTKALESDLADIQQGSTAEGIHLGALAGSVDMLVRCYTGLEYRADRLWLHPVLPDELDAITFTINYHQQPIRLDLTRTNLRMHLAGVEGTPITVNVEGADATLVPGETRDFAVGLSKPTPGDHGRLP